MIAYPRSKIVDDYGNLPAEWVAYLQQFVAPAYYYQVPLTGFAITIPNSVTTLILEPAGTLATGTVTLPTAPTDGQVVRITSTQTITALTVSVASTQTVRNAPTTFVPSLTGLMGYEFIFVLSNATWYRVQ